MSNLNITHSSSVHQNSGGKEEEGCYLLYTNNFKIDVPSPILNMLQYCEISSVFSYIVHVHVLTIFRHLMTIFSWSTSIVFPAVLGSISITRSMFSAVSTLYLVTKYASDNFTNSSLTWRKTAILLVISSMHSLCSCSSFFLYSLSLPLSLSLCIITLCSRDTNFPLLTNLHTFTFINSGYHLHEHNTSTCTSIHLITTCICSWGSGVGWVLSMGG